MARVKKELVGEGPRATNQGAEVNTQAFVPARVRALSRRTNAQPLTERIVEHLPGPARTWKLLWSMAPLLQSVALTPLLTTSGNNPYGWSLLTVAIPLNLILSFAILHAIWGVARVTREARGLEAGDVSVDVGAERTPGTFRGMANAGPPLLLTASLTLVLGFDAVRLMPSQIALVKAPFDFLTYLPIITWIWTYLMLMLGLQRLGNERLTFSGYCGDPGLGLQPVGRLASTGFWIFVANLSPILLLNVSYGLGLFIGLAFFVAGVVAFFLSLLGLHRQMEGVKRVQLAMARNLYAQAYSPLRLTPTTEVLQERSPLLSAAEALERRAEMIQTWPFTNAIFARIVVIATSVVTAIVTRIAVDSLGF